MRPVQVKALTDKTFQGMQIAKVQAKKAKDLSVEQAKKAKEQAKEQAKKAKEQAKKGKGLIRGRSTKKNSNESNQEVECGLCSTNATF